jgi:hypothetical protein
MASEESRSGVRARSHIRRVAVIVLVLCLALALGAGAASAKKKKSKPSVFTASAAPNLVVPDQPGGTARDIIVTSTLTAGKKFKGKTVGDLNITGLQTTGSGPNAAGSLDLMLVGPGGRSVLFDAGALGGQSIGPVTFDDDTPTSYCDDPPCSDPDATLQRPFVGTTNLANTFGGDTGPLAAFNGTPMRGIWTLYAWDSSNDGRTNVINAWGLRIAAAKPVKA